MYVHVSTRFCLVCISVVILLSVRGFCICRCDTKIVKMKKVKRVALGDKVFAKVKGYPAWPARVEEDLGKKYKVYFYGTGETGMVKAEDLFSYVEHKDQFVKSLKRKDYNEAIEEIEAAIAQDGIQLDEAETALVSDVEKDEDVKRGLKRKHSIDSSSGNESKKKTAPKTTEERPSNQSKKINAVTASTKSEKEKKSTVSESATNTQGKKSPESVLSDEENEELLEKQISNKEGTKVHTESESSSEDEEEEDEEEEEEEEESSEDEQNKPTKFIVVTPKMLRDVIEEFEKCVKDAELGNEKPEEEPESELIKEVLLARIERDKYVGIKLNRNKPDRSFETEIERLRWKEADARAALDLKEKVEEGSVKPEGKPEVFEFELELTEEQLKDATDDRIMERKRTKLKFLKIEATLVELDAAIKTNLALDKADPKEALKDLDMMLDLGIEPLMLKKHAHVMEMVKRLRRYIGNVKEWKLQGKDLDEFKKDAEQIRAKAEVVYSKFKGLFNVPEGKSFWEVFNDECEKFKTLTKDMMENQMFILCAEPGTRQAQWDELDDEEELKIMAERNKIEDKENSSQVLNSEETVADLSAENSNLTQTSTDSHG